MSEERSRSIRLQTARELEERGFVDKAVALYLKAGAPGEAARLLVSKERYRDAGQLMLDALGVLPDDAGRLEGAQRNAAAKAARCFALGGDEATAGRILRALGVADGSAAARPSMPPDVLPRTAPIPSVAPPASASAPEPVAARAPTPRAATIAPATRPEPSEKWGRASGWKTGQVDETSLDKAIAQLLEQGKPGQAARVAWDAGRLEDAARWFAEAGFDYETGSVLLELERFEEAIERLVRVAPDHKRHRAAGAKLVDAADRIDRFDFEIDRALARFAKAPPIDAAELPTYLRLADLYARHGFAEGARDALEQIVLFDPAHAGARAALERIAPPTPAARHDPRAARSHAPPVPGSLPALPTVAELVALARQHAPPRRAARR